VKERVSCGLTFELSGRHNSRPHGMENGSAMECGRPLALLLSEGLGRCFAGERLSSCEDHRGYGAQAEYEIDGDHTPNGV
jgi:hypothetical protein